MVEKQNVTDTTPIETKEKDLLIKSEKAKKNWAAYKSIEDDMGRIVEYLPLETKQYMVFSFKLADIIIRCCTQVESVFKDLVRERMFLENLSKDDYEKLNKLNLTKEAFTIRANGDAFAPFSIFFEDETNKSIPFWWTTYNKLKHDYSKNLELANLQAAICALGSLFILNCKIPYNQETLILNGVISSPNFIHIGHFLGYMAQEEKTKIYNVLAQTSIFQYWVSYNLETIGLTVTGSMQVGSI